MQWNIYKLTNKRALFDRRLAEIEDAEGREIVRKKNVYSLYWFATWCVVGPIVAPFVVVYLIGYGIVIAADWVSDKVQRATDALGDLINLGANSTYIPGWSRATDDLCDAIEKYAPTRIRSKNAPVPHTGESAENP